MRFENVRLVSGATALRLPIVGALPSDPYILKAADGFGPPEVDVAMLDTLYEGGLYSGRRPHNRQIVLRIGLNPDYAAGEVPADLRSTLYGLLLSPAAATPVIKIQPNIGSASPIAQALGYVSKFETVQWSKDPEVQITFECDGPYLAAPTALTPTITTKTAFTVTNPGDAPVGFQMRSVFTSNVAPGDFTVTLNGKTLDVQDFNRVSGDEIWIDTRPGHRSVLYKNNVAGTTASLLTYLTDDSEWLEMVGGANAFTVSTNAWTWSLFSYTPNYWGV